MKARKTAVATQIEARIQTIRGETVMLDADLAAVYDVSTRVLNQAVKRNRDRFPADFVFRLTAKEVQGLRSQTVISKEGRGGRRSRPWAFTEHGAIMAATVLNSPRAVEMSVFVVRAFVRLHHVIGTHSQLAAKLSELERRLAGHDEDIRAMFEAIRRLMAPPERPRRRIGFHAGKGR